jgi:hypothetical protein
MRRACPGESRGVRSPRSVRHDHPTPHGSRPWAEGPRSAALDRRHDLELAEAHMAGVGGTPSRPAVAEDVRHLDRWP